jgi:hypothetical protein
VDHGNIENWRNRRNKAKNSGAYRDIGVSMIMGGVASWRSPGRKALARGMAENIEKQQPAWHLSAGARGVMRKRLAPYVSEKKAYHRG